MTRTVQVSAERLKPGDVLWTENRAKRVQSHEVTGRSANDYPRERTVTFDDGSTLVVSAYARLLRVPAHGEARR